MDRRDEMPRTSDLANPVKEDELTVEEESDLSVSQGSADKSIDLDRDLSPTTETQISLVEEGDRVAFLSRWKEIQSDFVDEPRGAVSDADGLVAELMQHLARNFADVRSGLEAQWDRKEDVSTEDLRLALQRYRAFFRRLLET
jgi:hypothetical protein